MAKAVFEERQRFNQWWIWLIILGIFAYEVYLLTDLVQEETLNSKTLSSYLLIMLPILIVLLVFLFSSLYTRIDESGIQTVFKPFGFTKKSFSWRAIETVETITYSPLKDFGGWGYRLSFSGKGTAYNVKGNQGISIQLKNGKKFLIGTQKSEQALEVIESFSPSKK